MVPLVACYLCFSLIQENRLATIVCETQKSGTRYTNFFLFPLKKKKKTTNLSPNDGKFSCACYSHYQGPTHFPAWTAQLTCFHESPFAQGYESKLAVSSSEFRLPRRAVGFFPSFPDSIVIPIGFIYKLAMLCKGAIGKSAPRNIELTLLKLHFRI